MGDTSLLESRLWIENRSRDGYTVLFRSSFSDSPSGGGGPSFSLFLLLCNGPGDVGVAQQAIRHHRQTCRLRARRYAKDGLNARGRMRRFFFPPSYQRVIGEIFSAFSFSGNRFLKFFPCRGSSNKATTRDDLRKLRRTEINNSPLRLIVVTFCRI